MSVLEVRDLTIALPPGGDRREAAARVSFSVDKGEIVCLVGESGSGKSVIAQAIMGLLPKTLPVSSGEVLLEGERDTAVRAVVTGAVVPEEGDVAFVAVLGGAVAEDSEDPLAAAVGADRMFLGR